MSDGEMRASQMGDRHSAKRNDIQGLRAVAVILVVAYHAGLPVKGGYLGVDVFFVVSGYVITAMLVRELERNGRISFRQFYSRRVRRLLPAFAVAVGTTLLCVSALGAFGAVLLTTNTGIAGALLNANTYLSIMPDGYFAPEAQGNALLHLWSLSAEEQFYLVYPILIAGLWRATAARRPLRSLTVGVAIVTVASFALHTALSNGWVSIARATQWAFYSSPTRAWQLGVGALAAMWIFKGRRIPQPLASWISGGAFGSVLALAFLVDDSASTSWWVLLIVVAGTALVLVAGEPSRPPVTRDPVTTLLTRRPMVFLGDISYGWYLWHWPMIVFAAATFPNVPMMGPMMGVASLAPALASQRWVENPVRFSPNLSRRRFLAVVAAGVALPLAIGAGVRQLNPWLKGRPFAADTASHLDWVNRCDELTNADGTPLERCDWRFGDASRSLVLIGDSNAGHLTEGVLEVGRALQLRVRVAVQNGCPFLNRPVTILKGCSEFVERSLAELHTSPPDVVVLAMSERYLTNPAFAIENEAGTVSYDPQDKARSYGSALVDILADLSDRGTRVVLVHQIPKFKGAGARGLSALRLWAGTESGGTSASRSVSLADRAPAVEAQMRAAAETGQFTFDPAVVLCPEERCHSTYSGHWLYRDDRHLSVWGALVLAAPLQEAVDEALRHD